MILCTVCSFKCVIKRVFYKDRLKTMGFSLKLLTIFQLFNIRS